ncbi:MAG: MFS transporter [Candidatus Caldarchaeum sp.]
MSRKNKTFIWFSVFSAMFTAQMTMPVIGLYSSVMLRADPFTVGLIYGSAALTAFVFRIPAALMTRGIGEKKTMVLGLSASSLGYIIYGMATRPDHMVLGSLVRGLGSAFFFPAALTTMYEEANEGKGVAKNLGYMLTGPAMGMTLGPVFGAASLTVGGYQQTFYAAAVISIAATTLTSLTEEHHRENGQTSFTVLKNPRFVSILVSRLFINYVTGTIAAFLPLMANQVLGYSEAVVLLLFTAAAFTNLLSRVLMGSAAAKIGPGNYVALGSFIVSVAAILLIFANEGLTWTSMIIYGFGMGVFVLGSVYVGGMIIPSSMRTVGFAFLTLMIDLGASMGQFFSGILLSTQGFAEVFAVASIIGLLGCCIDVFSQRRLLPVEKQRQSSPE